VDLSPDLGTTTAWILKNSDLDQVGSNPPLQDTSSDLGKNNSNNNIYNNNNNNDY